MRTESKYTLHLTFVKDNLERLGFEACAKAIGVSTPALKKQITEWRNKDIVIPHLRIVSLGTITTRKDRGVMRQFIKTEKGWRRLGRITPYKDKERVELKPKVSKAPPPKRAPKPEIKRLPNRQEDMSGKKWVKIDNKTMVLRKVA